MWQIFIQCYTLANGMCETPLGQSKGIDETPTGKLRSQHLAVTLARVLPHTSPMESECTPFAVMLNHLIFHICFQISKKIKKVGRLICCFALIAE